MSTNEELAEQLRAIGRKLKIRGPIAEPFSGQWVQTIERAAAALSAGCQHEPQGSHWLDHDPLTDEQQQVWRQGYEAGKQAAEAHRYTKET